jgi:hypothetical protein
VSFTVHSINSLPLSLTSGTHQHFLLTPAASREGRRASGEVFSATAVAFPAAGFATPPRAKLRLPRLGACACGGARSVAAAVEMELAHAEPDLVRGGGGGGGARPLRRRRREAREGSGGGQE